ncbi:hypothetical protein BDR05DRAFT_956571 [Suillus weaverae]|nr:hypothetical protein BDR05DRAFT_956571 [Suillus weaverae]
MSLMRSASNFNTFDPLTHFPGLQELSLTSFCMSWIDNNALGCIIRYWPRLRYFDLGIQNFWQTQPKITLHGLTTILSRIDEAWSGIRRYEYKSTYD